MWVDKKGKEFMRRLRTIQGGGGKEDQEVNGVGGPTEDVEQVDSLAGSLESLLGRLCQGASVVNRAGGSTEGLKEVGR